MGTPTLSRREFVARAVTATALFGTTSNVYQAAGTETAQHLKYFDIHVHLTQGWYGSDRGPLTVRKLLIWMDAHSIERAAVLPLVSPEAFWYPITNEFVLRETSLHRDRLIPFCAIDPRALSTHLTKQQDVVDMLKRYRDAGACGFGEHKSKIAFNDPLNRRLFQACAEIKLPVLFHLDEHANYDEPGLPGLASSLAEFPELIMIGHGKGWWASISGGLTQADLHVGRPRGPVRPGGAIDALMKRFDNLYGDLSSSGANAILRDPVFGQSFLKRWSNRLLFGTDYYDLTQLDFPQFCLLNEFKLTNEERDNIARNNSLRILQMN